MNWKRLQAITAAGALSLAMLATAAAQSQPPAAGAPSAPPAATKQRPMGHGMHGMQNLNLTDEQKTQIQSIKAKQREQAKAIRADSTLNDTQKKDKLKSLRRDSRKQINGVLTPEQRQQMKENMKERRQAKQAQPKG